MSFLKAIMNVRDAANLLGCTERHIEGLCCNGRLRGAKKKGGLWEIPLAAIQAYEREQPARLLVDKQLLYRVRDYLLIYYQFCGQEGLLIAQKIQDLKLRKRCDRSEISRLEDKLRGIIEYQGQVWSDFRRIESELSLEGATK
jgi:excisionase family DNA binding protein